MLCKTIHLHIHNLIQQGIEKLATSLNFSLDLSQVTIFLLIRPAPLLNNKMIDYQLFRTRIGMFDGGLIKCTQGNKFKDLSNIKTSLKFISVIMCMLLFISGIELNPGPNKDSNSNLDLALNGNSMDTIRNLLKDVLHSKMPNILSPLFVRMYILLKQK